MYFVTVWIWFMHFGYYFLKQFVFCVCSSILVSNRYCVVWFFFVLAFVYQCSQFLSYNVESKNMHVFLMHSNEVFANKLHRNNHAKNAYITSTKQENVVFCNSVDMIYAFWILFFETICVSIVIIVTLKKNTIFLGISY
jgi:hypothetical protein